MDHAGERTRNENAKFEPTQPGAEPTGDSGSTGPAREGPFHTDVERALAALQTSEERYRKLVETAPDAITVTDLEGRLVMTNEPAARLHGYDSIEAFLSCGKSAFDWVAPEDRERALVNAQKTLQEGQIRQIEYKLLRDDGTRISVELSASVLQDPEGRPAGFIGVVRDITERKRAEEERRRLEAQIQRGQKLESLGLLAGGIAHDFNNLLTGILGNASLALLSLPEGDSAREHVRQIEIAAARAAELTQQLLAYSGMGRLSVEPVDLTALVEEMEGLLSLSVPKKVNVEMALDPDIPAVDGDASQLRQVCMNLVINGAEAVGDHPGVVRIATGVLEARRHYLSNSYTDDKLPEGRYVYLDVSDDGCGMSKATLAKLFDPFFSTKRDGRGLGLAVVLGIVRGHQGAIRVTSRPGKGTTVRVLLPTSQSRPRHTAPDEAAPEQYEGAGTVLIIDDEPSVLRTASAMLGKLGYNTLTAADGRAGLALFHQHRAEIRAVLLDLTMPELSGEETLGALRELRPDLPVLLSSGYDEGRVAERTAQGSSVHFLQKPYRYSDLARAMRETLGES